MYSPTEEQHFTDVTTVLATLEKAGAILNLEKSHFHRTSVEFLGHIVDQNGISPNPAYVQSILEWPQLKDQADIASFCGLVNYFKQWIDGYAFTLKPLNELRKKNALFKWTVECQTAVRILQHQLSTAPVLAYFDPEQETVITTDASAYAVGGWLGQRPTNQPNEVLKPLLFWSRKCKDAETRYGTHERELLAIVNMLAVCRPYIEGRTFIVKTDHKALIHLNTQPVLSRRQAGWVEKLQHYDMRIEYSPGILNTVADILSWKPDYNPNCPRCSAKFEEKPGHIPRAERNRTVEPAKIALNATRLTIAMPFLDQASMSCMEDD